MKRINWWAAGRALPGCVLSVGGPFLVFTKPHVVSALVGLVLASLAPTVHGAMLSRNPPLAAPKAGLLAAIERRSGAAKRFRIAWDPRPCGGIVGVVSSAVPPYLHVMADFDASDPEMCDLTIFRAVQLIATRRRLARFIADLTPSIVGCVAAVILLDKAPDYPDAALLAVMVPRFLTCCAFNRLFRRQAINIDRAAISAGFSVETVRRSLRIPDGPDQRTRRRTALVRMVEARARALNTADSNDFAIVDGRMLE
jgi:hypothetical protein